MRTDPSSQGARRHAVASRRGPRRATDVWSTESARIVPAIDRWRRENRTGAFPSAYRTITPP